jgi:hypothetical protein
MIVRDTYCWTNPYVNGWIHRFYGTHCRDLYGTRVFNERHFLELLATFDEQPEYMLKWCFDSDRAAMVSICRELGINVAFGEDGFFPHYSAIHVDPLGFCWESSLTRMVFRGATDRQRERARTARTQWLNTPEKELPSEVKAPFVFWPLQLIQDQVNEWDLRVKDWCGLLRHFRAALPAEFQLVLKQHPMTKDKDVVGLADLVKQIPNTILLPKEAHLVTLLRHARAVAGANSSVLYEARLMHQKPTYCYARSWFTNHSELFLPVVLNDKRPLPRLDWLEEPKRMRTPWLDDYADWFVAQLLARQYSQREADRSPADFKKHIARMSWHSYREHGEAIFD